MGGLLDSLGSLGGQVFNQTGTSTSRRNDEFSDFFGGNFGGSGPQSNPGGGGIGNPSGGFGFNPARSQLLNQNFQARLAAAQTGNPAAISATAITGAGELFARSVSSAFGVEDPREAQARLTQEAALEAATHEAQPGTPEYTRAIVNAFAGRGLASEALQALSQGKDLERQQQQITLGLARQRQAEVQTDKLLEAQNQEALGQDFLSREEIIKSEGGRTAWGRAGFEVARRQQARTERGDERLGPEAAKLLQQKLATAALVQQSQQTSTTQTTGDTGTTVSRTTRSPIDLSNIGLAPGGSVGPSPASTPTALAPGRPSPPTFSNPAPGPAVAARQAEEALSAPVPEAERTLPRTRIQAARPGPTVLKPTTRAPLGGGAKAKRDRVLGARKELQPVANTVNTLNQLIGEIERVGPLFDADVRVPIPGAGDLRLPFGGIRDAVGRAVGDRLFPGGAEAVRKRTRDRVKLSGAYQELLSTIVKAYSGAAASDAEREAVMKQAIDPTSMAAQTLGKDGLIEAYKRLYEGLAGRAQNISDRFSEPVKLPEFHPAIRRQLRR